MNYKNPECVSKNFDSYYDRAVGEEKELMKDVSFSEAIKLEREDGTSIFLLHGHQADWFNYVCWKLSRFLVRVLWKPLQVLGIDDPTSPAENYTELIKVEKRLEKWIRKNKNQVTITGHTHRPRFPKPKELPYFNSGSCVHPRCITGLEIENNRITLIKWHIITIENGTMKIIRTVLEDAKDFAEYF